MEIISGSVDLLSGNQAMRCHLARSAIGGQYPGLIVAMEARGLNDQIRPIPDRFAAEGFVTMHRGAEHRHILAARFSAGTGRRKDVVLICLI
jgi:hypothetical protein